MNERPSDSAPCQTCNHPFGEHYLTFNGNASGCTHDLCICEGFYWRRR